MRYPVSHLNKLQDALTLLEHSRGNVTIQDDALLCLLDAAIYLLKEKSITKEEIISNLAADHCKPSKLWNGLGKEWFE